jgi:hypothetical protein
MQEKLNREEEGKISVMTISREGATRSLWALVLLIAPLERPNIQARLDWQEFQQIG